MGVMNFLTGLLPTAAMAAEEMPLLAPGQTDLHWIGAVFNWINSGIGNIGWTMVLFTVLLKLVTFPLDFISRKSMKKNTIIQERLAPELARLERQCKGDKTLYQQKMMARMKKEGYSMAGACLPSLVTIIFFFFVLAGLNSFATFNNAELYTTMATAYNTEVFTDSGEVKAEYEGLTREEIVETETVSRILIETYQEFNPSWLWVKNPWRPDMFWADAFPSDEEFANGQYSIGGLPIDIDDGELASEVYDALVKPIKAEYGGRNGLFILPILAMAFSFLSQFIMQKLQPPQPAADPSMNTGMGMMKVMMYVFPILMVFFAISYTAAFTIYIVCNSILSLLSSLFINWLVGKILTKQFEKKDREAAAGYRRKN